MENKIKHLELIQGIINRMSSNSFMLKGWAVTLVTGFFAISSKDADKMYFMVAYIPVLLFWYFDTYYFRQERLYRYLYDEVRQKKETEIDFSLNAAHFEKEPDSKYMKCFFSNTEIRFYLPLFLLCTLIIYLH